MRATQSDTVFVYRLGAVTLLGSTLPDHEVDGDPVAIDIVGRKIPTLWPHVEVDDVDAAVAYLRAKGCAVTGIKD
ncbi:MAG: hypothetical protein QM770_10930 [Tepidisphaeraceae bacterium]